MNYELVVTPSAKRDIAEARYYYAQFGKADHFLAVVEDAFELISQRPLMFPVAYEHVRRALVRRFPFSIFFVLDDHRAVVLAVHHRRRDPAKRPSSPR